MNIVRIIFITSALVLATGLTACDNKKPGPAETAGKNVDQAVDKASQSVAKTADATGQVMTDTALTTKVKSAILAEPSLKVMQISVKTTDGVVTLDGDVDSKEHSELAARIAGSVDGVKSVKNQLVVKSETVD
jgi:hyperosmotically inducible protein